MLCAPCRSRTATVVTALPVDVAVAVAAAGIDIELGEDELVAAIRSAIADRADYFDGPELGDIGIGAYRL
jgi:hypothetical protein